MAEPAQQQAQAYAPDGSPIAPEETAAAVREGRAFFQQGAKVFARNPEGDLVTIAPEDAHLPGYQVLSAPELAETRLRRSAESAGGLAKTAGEGLVRGGTMGFAGLEQFYDKEGREAARARQQYNPNLSAGSELAGALGATVAASALSGGAAAEGTGARLAQLAARGALTPFRAASALGEAAEAAVGGAKLGQGLLAAGARMGARGAAEGALMGVGHEVSQAALEDVPLTAERLLAGAWDGGKVGGAFGLGLGVLGSGVGKAGRAIIGRMAESGDDMGKATRTWAEKAMFKQQVGNNGKIYDEATSFGQDMARPARIGRKLLDADMPTAAPAALKRAGQLADDAAGRLQAVARTADDAGIEANVERLLGSVDELESKLRETPFGDFQAIADRVKKQIEPFRRRVEKRNLEFIRLQRPVDVPPIELVSPVKVMPRPSAQALAAQREMLERVAPQITDAEAEAVRRFTHGYDQSIRNLQRGMDDADVAAMHPRGAAHAAEARESIEHLESYMHKVPAADNAPAYRGLVMNPDDAQAFLKQSTFFADKSKRAVTSVSADPIVARSFVARNLEPGQVGITLKLKHSSAVPAGNFAAGRMQVEKELLMPGNTEFRVLRRYEDASNPGNFIIEAEQIGGRGSHRSHAGTEIAKSPSLKFSELWELRKKLDKTINWEKKAGGPAEEALRDVRDAFRAELDTALAGAADNAPPELLTAWKKASEDYSDFALIKKSLKELQKRRDKNRAISPSDYATGALMGILTGNAVTGMATSAAAAGVHKLIRERGAGVLAKIADRMGGVAGQMEKAGKMAALVEKPRRLATPAAVSIGRLFERYSATLNQANADPIKFSEQMAAATADLTLRAPEVASQIQRTMMADLKYLNELHPAPATRKNNTLTPLAKAPEFYAFDQKRAFVDAAMALDNPVGVFEDIARGELPLTKIQALKARRPLLFGEMKRTVIKYTSTREEELPFNRRVLLGTAFDFPADWSMLHVGEIQESLASGDASGKPNDPTAAPSKVGKDPGAAMNPGQF